MSSKIYTKKGDTGTTSLLSGRRVSKLYPEIRAVGALDELNSHVGLLLHKCGWLSDTLLKIQWNLFNAGSVVINDNNTDLVVITEDDVNALESAMDTLSKELPDLKNFILPNGTESQCYAHICRTVCRRAEIEVLNCLTVAGSTRVAIIAKYLNRLSDFFFVLARYLGHVDGVEELVWKNAISTKQNENE